MIRKVGDFVGRRPELRAILRDLRRGVPGVVLHGIGGIGKSSARRGGSSASSATTPASSSRSAARPKVDLILDAIRQRLLAGAARR